MSVQVLEGALAASKSKQGELEDRNMELEEQVKHFTQEQRMADLKQQDLLSRHHLEIAELEEQVASSKTNGLSASPTEELENGNAELGSPELQQLRKQILQIKVYTLTNRSAALHLSC